MWSLPVNIYIFLERCGVYRLTFITPLQVWSLPVPQSGSGRESLSTCSSPWDWSTWRGWGPWSVTGSTCSWPCPYPAWSSCSTGGKYTFILYTYRFIYVYWCIFHCQRVLSGIKVHVRIGLPYSLLDVMNVFSEDLDLALLTRLFSSLKLCIANNTSRLDIM